MILRNEVSIKHPGISFEVYTLWIEVSDGQYGSIDRPFFVSVAAIRN